jgi:LmbE family N-acetylglucosaminyl deacetylase
MSEHSLPHWPTAPSSLGTILSIWAHPDDETYLAAGVMAEAADAGHPVVCVSATAGELGTPDADAWPPARLERVRRWEAAASMAVLGVTDHRILGLPDGALDQHEEEGVALMGQLLEEIRPDTILTFGPDGMTYHPDHIAVHRWVTRAWLECDDGSRLLYATPTVGHLDRFRDLYEEWGVYMSDERPVGAPESDLAVHVNLDGPALDRKLTALHAMASQTRMITGTLDPDLYAMEVAEESFIEAHRSARHDAYASTPGTNSVRPWRVS